MKTRFYSTPEWQKLRAKSKFMWKRAGLPCGYCRKPIDWSKKVIVDHIKNRRDFPALALDERNIQVVHYACNVKKYHAVEKGGGKPITGPDGFPVGSDWSD